jgi:hypothetical protein
VLATGEEAAELLCVLLAEAGGCSLGLELGEVLLDCTAIAPDVDDPVVLEAWLSGLLLVALVCPLLGFVASGIPEAVLDALGVGAVELLEFEFGVAVEALVLCPVVLAVPALASVWPLLLLVVDFPALVLTVNCSFTCFTPAMDLAISFARFLSAFEGTVPVTMAVPLVTETCTFANAGSWPNLV